MFSSSQYLAAALAFIAPILVTLLKNVHWGKSAKQCVAIAVAVIISFVCSFIEIENYWGNFLNNLWITIAMVQVAYAFLWEKIKLETILRYKGVGKPKGDNLWLLKKTLGPKE